MSDMLAYDRMSPEALAHPHPLYARIRAEAPICYTYDPEQRQPVWLLTRYDDCVNFLKDSRFSKDVSNFQNAGGSDPLMEGAAAINRHMLMVDPPDHTRLRSLVSKAFTPPRIERMQPRIQAITDDLIARMPPGSEVDFINAFAFPLPITVIAELLGLPQEDRENFRRWSRTILLNSLKGEDMNSVGTAVLEFIMYFHGLFDQRRVAPGDDLISALLEAEEAGDRLTQQELISMIFLLLIAGHETTVNLLGSGMLTLLKHPDQFARLQADSSLVKSAVEEMLRYESPVATTSMRWALEEVEWGGHHIRKGELALAVLLAANRDPDVFPNPDVFDITRSPNRHIAFGSGIHYCLGAPLARLEGTVAFETLVRRLTHMQLAADPDSLQWTPTLLLRGLKSLPVRV